MGSVRANQRGRTILKVFATLKLEIANTGSRPTFAKGSKSSIVDLTFVDSTLIGGQARRKGLRVRRLH